MQKRKCSKSMDRNWWENWKPRLWRTKSSTSVTLDQEDMSRDEIRNGWLTLVGYDARFQQKQLAEKELKIASLYEAQQARALARVGVSPTNVLNHHSPQATTLAPGKVRQMFEERRTKAGIDKSHPLQPIQNGHSDKSRKHIPNGYPKVTKSSVSSSSVQERRTVIKSTVTHTVNNSVSHTNFKKHRIDTNLNGSGDLNHNTIQNSIPSKAASDTGLLESKKKAQDLDNLRTENGIDEVDKIEYRLEDETFPEALAPSPTPRDLRTPLGNKIEARSAPHKNETASVKRKTSPKRTVHAKSVENKARTPKTPSTPSTGSVRRAGSGSADSNGSTNKSNQGMQKVSRPIISKQTLPVKSPAAKDPSAAGGEGEPCTVCGRRFAPDRRAKHEEICKKAQTKKRKPYDALKHRLAGTEAEPFIRQLKTKPSKAASKPALNSTWRQKHEDFVKAIRAAKQMQAHINAGGKLSDLPPPPPSTNPDYVQCPHCGRRFNQAAAERHIPKCKDYSFNKPKPSQARRK